MASRRRYYTLASLLDAQPKGLVRNPYHRLLWDHFMTSEKLQRLRISRRCYSLLNKASVLPENLKSFYRTYRLPEDPFFPLFLSVKKNWLEQRRIWQEERRQAITVIMAGISGERRQNLELMCQLEEKHHSAGKHPVWDRFIIPKTKKRAGELTRLEEIQWQDLANHYLNNLSEHYRSLSTEEALKVEAKLIMGFNQMPVNMYPERQLVQERFRKLSKRYHPDGGGESTLFRRLKTARDILINELFL